MYLNFLTRVLPEFLFDFTTHPNAVYNFILFKLIFSACVTLLKSNITEHICEHIFLEKIEKTSVQSQITILKDL